eukprot:510650-Pleurochrysis_carterae.AAC.2
MVACVRARASEGGRACPALAQEPCSQGVPAGVDPMPWQAAAPSSRIGCALRVQPQCTENALGTRACVMWSARGDRNRLGSREGRGVREEVGGGGVQARDVV